MDASRWITGALIVVAIIAFLMLRERWRLRAVMAWASGRKFRFESPFSQASESVPAKVLSEIFSVGGARRWGWALHGEMDGVPAWIIECEASRAGKTTAWYTLVIWPVLGTAVSLVLARPTWRLTPILGVSEPTARPDPPNPAGWQVTGPADERRSWLNAERAGAMSRFSPPGVIGLQSGHAAFRLEGVITPALLAAAEHQHRELRRQLQL